MDFLFHKISEEEKEKIKKEAKGIVNSFSKQLSEVDSKMKEPLVERKDYERTENAGRDDSFSREIMFENAPQKNKNFIIAEEGRW